MKHDQFNQFLISHLARIEPLSRDARIAYWTASISGDKNDFDRYSALDVAYKKIYADKDTFDTLKKWRGDGEVTDSIDRRQLDILYRQHLRNQIPTDFIERISRLSSEIANKFNVYRATVNGRQLTSNEVRTVLRESTDSSYRQTVWESEKSVGAVVRDDLLELVALRNEAASSLGFENHYRMSLELSEQDPDEIIELFDNLAGQTHEPFAAMKAEVDEALSVQFGIPADQLMPWHYHDPFFQEAPRVFDVDIDRFYRDHDVVEMVSRFFDGIGMEVHQIVELSDLYEKEGKEQHAYCMDIDRRGDIRVLANVRNDEMWAGTMLHELGHAVYDLYIDPALPFLLREHTHIFATESIAMLFGRLSKDADWIQLMTGISQAEKARVAPALRRNQTLSQLVFTRWCQVMVRFEKALYEDPSQDLNALWWNLVEKYQLVSRPEGRDEPDWASKIHVVSHPAYYHNYMLGELLASQLDHVIQSRILNADGGRATMNGRGEVGEFLIEEFFKSGKRYRWDELIDRATGEPLNPKYFVEQYIG
jgi:peptidyl-dipeptidase A